LRDVIGQRRLLERVAAQVLRGGGAHAYGLHGPRSIGKRLAALRIAQTLNCLVPDAPPGGCGACRACLSIEAGTHPDVDLLTRADDRRDIAIEQVRRVQEGLALRPLEGRRRVVIVDDAAELSEAAEVAFLKTLEEPPRHATLMLLTPTPERLLETIRSRLQPLPFRPVPASEIAAALRQRFGAAAERHADAAGGRPGIAIRLATDEAARAERRRLDAEFYTLVGSGLTDRFAWAARLSDDPDARHRTREIERRLVEWGELVRDAAVTASGTGPSTEGATGTGSRPLRPDRAAETDTLARAVSARELVDTAMLLEQLRRDLDFNANARAMLELLALRTPYAAGLKGTR
jgi:DNA polymerase III subunit delta'